MKYDFCGYATKNNLRCSDGRTIRKDAFKDCDGLKVPLVWQHMHDDPDNVLGHAILENRDDGVFAYCTFNDTEKAATAKKLVAHGDINMMSIWANELVEKAKNVLHGAIREVSLVIHGANPEAFIENVAMAHGDDFTELDDEAIIYCASPFEQDEDIQHSDVRYVIGGKAKSLQHGDNNDDEGSDDRSGEKDKTVEDVLNSMTEEQRDVVDFLIGSVMEGSEEPDDNDDEGGKDVKHNLFDSYTKGQSGIYTGAITTDSGKVLEHSDVVAIIKEAEDIGSMRKAFLAHGITNVEYLFPDHKTLTNQPELIARDTGWVQTVMNGVHHSPFSRVKTLLADLTGDEARARGYIKGTLKEEEVISLLRRVTDPTTVYKVQAMDRDDLVDITELDAIAWLKWEMRFMLDEELARAYLIGDGRLSSDRFKIKEDRIRPIWKEEDLYCIKYALNILSTADPADRARAFIRGCIKSRKNYKGSGNPSLFTTEDMLSECLLLTDSNGRDLYDSEEKLRTKLRVKEIVTVPVMENQIRTDAGGKQMMLDGIIANLQDYNVGADKGGQINMFDDFDIDYNKQKYLIETRCSGALIKPYSAIVIETPVTAKAAG